MRPLGRGDDLRWILCIFPYDEIDYLSLRLSVVRPIIGQGD